MGTTQTVTVRYWAGAQTAAGVASEQVPGPLSVAEARHAMVQRHPGLAGIVEVCSFLREGVAAGDEEVVAAGEVLEVLPPFAGG